MATVLQHPFGTTTFGDFLRTAREQRGLTLQQISNETKIPRRLLESLEHGDLGAVPAGMYQRAEIRAYAKAVGLDQAVALSELERALAMRSTSGERDSGTDGATDNPRHRSLLDPRARDRRRRDRRRCAVRTNDAAPLCVGEQDSGSAGAAGASY